MRAALVLVTVIALGAGGLQSGRPVRLLPVDEASSDPELKRTRDDLLAAVRQRNPELVMRFVSPDLVLESVRPTDHDGWMSLWEELNVPRVDGEQEREYWSELESALSLGGAFTKERGAVSGRREFCAPYVFAALRTPVPAEFQGEELPWVLIRKDVEVRAAPDSKSRLIGRKSYELLEAPGAVHRDPNSDQMWQGVELQDGREAFVPADAIRNPAGYHACFAKIDGRWLLSTFTSRGAI